MRGVMFMFRGRGVARDLKSPMWPQGRLHSKEEAQEFL